MRGVAGGRPGAALTIALAGVLLAVTHGHVPAKAQDAPGVTLQADRSPIEFGQRVRLSGTVSPAAQGETVSIVDETGRERATTTTDAEGFFTVRLGPLETTTSKRAGWPR
jgi:hypothetical protein